MENRNIRCVSFIERSSIIHSNKYDYSKVEYINNETKVIIECPIHGEFLQRPHDHIKGAGCPGCKKQILSTSKSKNIDKFIEQSRAIHGDKYDYSKSIYKTTNHKLIIICPIHGEFEQRADSHISGVGCPICWNDKRKIMLIERNRGGKI